MVNNSVNQESCCYLEIGEQAPGNMEMDYKMRIPVPGNKLLKTDRKAQRKEGEGGEQYSTPFRLLSFCY